MPVGMYTHFHIKPSCGLVGKDGVIGNIDDVQSFYAAERAEAQLVWFSGDGFVEYSFPNPGIDRTMLKSLTVSAELCSEALGYNEAWPSDITLYVNGVEIGTWTCPGDFGEIKGQLTPGWWHGVTQHGLLVEWTTDETGSRFQEAAVSEKTVRELNIDPERPIKVRFAVKPDAKHRGGMNLFGKQFGNHPQEIKLSFLRGKPTPL